MARRKPYTKVCKTEQVRATHVKGIGDVVFKGFQCLDSECEEFIFVRKDDIGDDFEITCPNCGSILVSGGETKFYDYELLDERDGNVIQKGHFAIVHDDYVAEAKQYKYCIICNTLKPLEYFDQHRVRRSGHQGECRLCKAVYNDIKNQTRLTEQHREASQKRRLYVDLSGGKKLSDRTVLERFGNKCFKCGVDIHTEPKDYEIDHTLPAYYLWPVTTENATLLCEAHNGEKAGKWPSDYYTAEELKRLSVMTGLSFELLSGPAQYNPEAIEQLSSPEKVDELLAKYGSYMMELIKLRNRLVFGLGFDFFAVSKVISQSWVKEADKMLAINHSEWEPASTYLHKSA